MLWVQWAGRPGRVDEGVVQVLLHILGELDGIAAPGHVPVVDVYAHADGLLGEGRGSLRIPVQGGRKVAGDACDRLGELVVADRHRFSWAPPARGWPPAVSVSISSAA